MVCSATKKKIMKGAFNERGFSWPGYLPYREQQHDDGSFPSAPCLHTVDNYSITT